MTQRIEGIQSRMAELDTALRPSIPLVQGPSGVGFERSLAAAQAGQSVGGTLSPTVTGRDGSTSVTQAQFASVDRPVGIGSTPAKGALSDQELHDVLANAGFSGDALRTAWALARRESGGRPDAVSKPNSNGTIDHGLFQINDVHRGSWIDFSRLSDPQYAAQVAYRMSDGGKDFSAWGLGSSGWAGHLQRTAPATYAELQQRFASWYAKYPFAD